MTESERYALVIDYEFCTGCHACEVACKTEHGYDANTWGIRVLQDGPREIEKDVWEYNNLPMPTSLCDLCQRRVSEGRLPTCVHHCQAGVMEYGTVTEMSELMRKKSKLVMFTPR